MAAFHRFVLEAPSNTVVPPYHAVFAVRGEPDGAKFRGGKPVLRFAGTHRLNSYHPPLVRRALEAYAEQSKDKLETLSLQVRTMQGKTGGAMKSAAEIRAYVDKELKMSSNIEVRKDADIFVQKDAMFLGISVAAQTPGHLLSHNLIEVHVALSGCYAMYVGNAGAYRIGDPIFETAPLFKHPTQPLGYVVAGKTEHDVVISIDRRAIGITPDE